MTLSYVEQGKPSTFAIVCVHGPTDSWHSYSPMLAHIDSSLRCVAVSQRGHGDSDKPQSGYDVATFAADLVTFLASVEVDRAVLVGHSGSCPVVRRVAIDHPDRVAGLVLEASPTTLSGDPVLIDFLESVVRDLDDPIDPDFVRAFVADTSSPEQDTDLFVEEARKVPARAWREMFEDLLTYDDVAELNRVAVPTLLIWGDADPLMSRSMQDELLARLPDASLVVYAGAGHTVRWEQPQRFANDVANFAVGLRRF